MLKATIAALLIVCGPICFGQRTEVVVESSKMVQVSTGEQSPNITQVGSATVYYITCYNVVYCGPSATAASPITYAFASALPAPVSLQNGLATFGSGITSPILPGEGNHSSTSIESSLATFNISAGLISNYHETSFTSTEGKGGAIGLPGIIANSLSAGQDPLSNPIGLASNSPCEKASSSGTICGLILPVSYSVGFQASATQLPGQSFGDPGFPSPLSISGPSTIEELKGIWSSSAEGINGLLGRSTGPHSSDSLLTLASLEQPHPSIFPLGGSSLGAGYSGIAGIASDIGPAGLAHTYQSVFGTDMESLSRQMTILGQGQAKILGWTILYANQSDGGTAH